MALRVKITFGFNAGYPVSASSGIHQGMIVALAANGSTGVAELAKANRDGTHAAGAVVGIAAEDASTTGNTQVIINPVTIEPEAHYARRIGDLQDETAPNQTNWSDTGYAKRGVTVYSVGGEFGTDQYDTDDIVDNGTADTATGDPTYTVNTPWTYGAGAANAGLFVSDAAAAGTAIGRVTGAVAGGLLPFRYVYV